MQNFSQNGLIIFFLSLLETFLDTDCFAERQVGVTAILEKQNTIAVYIRACEGLPQ